MQASAIVSRDGAYRLEIGYIVARKSTINDITYHVIFCISRRMEYRLLILLFYAVGVNCECDDVKKELKEMKGSYYFFCVRTMWLRSSPTFSKSRMCPPSPSILTLKLTDIVFMGKAVLLL